MGVTSEKTEFLTGGGFVGALMRDRDWSRSPLGDPERWTSSLKTTVGLLLRAEAQIVLFWGEQSVALYNDAYAPTIGDKHPTALGRPAKENWTELWDDLEPLLRGVRDTGKTFSARDRPFYIERHGFGETVYFDISYSAVPEADGRVGGVLCIVSETTERVRAAAALRESEARCAS
jgi:PAS domain-containing protein